MYMYGVCDIQAHAIIDEMLYNGFRVDANKSSVLAPLRLLEKAA